MNGWKQAARDALVSGSMASITSTAALMACGDAEIGRPLAPTNAVGHWFFGDRATREDHFRWPDTIVGYVTHHAAAVFWALWYEKLFGAQRAVASPAKALADAGAVAALACFVDYRLTPRRLMPGYERRLSRRSLAAVYTAFAAGLALGGALLSLAPAMRRR